jgi:hypothetical protein
MAGYIGSGSVKLTANNETVTGDETVTGNSSVGGDLAVTGTTTLTGNLLLGDNDKAIFGAGSDLQIYHDGSNSYIKDVGTGDLTIAGTNLQIRSSATNENFIYCVENGAVNLYHNDAQKLATTATGIDVTGAITADGLTVDGGNGDQLSLDNAGERFTQISFKHNGAQEAALWYDATDDYLVAHANAGDGFKVQTGGSNDRLTIDSSGNVGIGTSSPTQVLVVSESSTPTIQIKDGAASGTRVSGRLHIGEADTLGVSIENSTSAYNDNCTMVFKTSPAAGTITERMRLTSAGDLLLGKTSANSDNAGFEANASGFTAATRSNGTVFVMDRLVSDGTIIDFRKANTVVGSIGTANGGDLYIGNDGTGVLFAGGSNAIIPVNPSTTAFRDNAIDLGHPSYRFDDIYATNGTIQTSDANEKQDIASLTSAEMLVAKRISALFKTFRWKDKVAAKGNDARTHTGIIAQDVQAAFTAEGLDAGDYSLFTSSTWWETQTDVAAVEADEDNEIEAVDAYTRTDTYDTQSEAPEGATERTRMGIRYPELLAFVGAYNEQRFADIETRLAALEAV